MTDETTLDPALSDDALLAGEFVLGLLEGERLLLARGKLAREPGFADEVAHWEEHFAPLLDRWDAVEPPVAVWDRIESETSAGIPSASENVVSLDSMRISLMRWRVAAAVMGAVAIVSLLTVLNQPIRTTDPVPEPLLAASIPIADTPLRLALTYVPEREQLSVSSIGLTADGVHDHELWLVDREGELHSLGVIVPGEEARFAVSSDLAEEFRSGAELVLTREPLGGKPANADAGPVVAEGQFRAI